MGRSFICSNCVNAVTAEPLEELCSDVEPVNAVFLERRINACGRCKVVARAGWKKFRECEELLCGKRFPIKINGKFYQCYVRLAILYGNKTWCLKESEMAVLRRTK